MDKLDLESVCRTQQFIFKKAQNKNARARELTDLLIQLQTMIGGAIWTSRPNLYGT
jgi:hypothetical protein